ncbi:hypothetical protein BS50DRAFT_371622 [Corynespora cassiicola Philippines]|uniref:Secreted protein n=1 Tax=Corynespora cassiicola Philippines TaxID=1448308 RepID=A0A2T2NMN1_CORCC|nr:hypothetical protein BS50DRAFT_371622 [Corynespora cassiicola Philippines]
MPHTPSWLSACLFVHTHSSFGLPSCACVCPVISGALAERTHETWRPGHKKGGRGQGPTCARLAGIARSRCVGGIPSGGGSHASPPDPSSRSSVPPRPKTSYARLAARLPACQAGGPFHRRRPSTSAVVGGLCRRSRGEFAAYLHHTAPLRSAHSLDRPTDVSACYSVNTKQTSRWARRTARRPSFVPLHVRLSLIYQTMVGSAVSRRHLR